LLVVAFLTLFFRPYDSLADPLLYGVGGAGLLYSAWTYGVVATHNFFLNYFISAFGSICFIFLFPVLGLEINISLIIITRAATCSVYGEHIYTGLARKTLRPQDCTISMGPSRFGCYADE
jgi:hypothetical protein